MMDIAKKIIELLEKQTYKHLERNHKTLKILKTLGIGELKEDIQSVYAHALVEYAADAVTLELVTLLALKEVKQAFQTSLHKNRETELDHIVEHQFNSNEKVAFLKNIYKSAAELQPEIQRFRQLYDSFTLQSGDALLLKMYNESKKFQLEILEEKQRKSFDYQAGQYLTKLIEAFHTDFLKDNRYIDLNAETRAGKQTPTTREGSKTVEKGKESEDGGPDYDSIPHRPMDTYINQWLSDNRRKFLVIVGEYGTGKTTFLRRLAHQLASNRLGPGKETAMADPGNRLPLFFPLRDFEKTMETYIVSRLNVDGITDIDFARFRERIKNNECILLLDGFDEMTQKIDADEKGRNFDKIRTLIETAETSKIILTTRQEYFQSSAELREVFKHEDKTNYDFIHLLSFDDDQIQQYLKTHTDNPDFYWEQIEEIFDLHDLAKRPVLLELLVKYLPKLVREAEKETIDASDLYKRCINDELDRKSKKLKFIVPGKHRLEILQKLAVWLFLNNVLSFDTGLLESELNLKQYFKTERAWEFEKYLNEFLTFTFLIRESDHRFRMSHKSFRDYLTAQSFVREINTGKTGDFSKNKTTGEINHFMREQGPDKKELLKRVLTARDLSEETQWQGTNAATILLRMDKAGLKGEDLSRCQLSYVDFWGCDLTGTNFKETNLSNCKFNHKSILSAQLGNTNFENSSLDLYNKGIKDITFLKAFKSLADLWLYSNEISDISPLKHLKKLNKLSLWSNPITDISPIQGLTQLNWLDLSSTQISDISPIQGLKNLRDLYLSKDQVPETQIKAVKEAIPGITIHII